MTNPVERAAIALYDRFTHEGMDRRVFMAELTRIAGGAAAASALLGSIACQAQATPQVAPDDGRIRTQPLTGSRARAGPITATTPPRQAARTISRWSSSSTKIAASTIISATSRAASPLRVSPRSRPISSAWPAARPPTTRIRPAR